LRTSTQIASVSPKSASNLSLSSIFGVFIVRQGPRDAKLNRCSRFLRACRRPQTDRANVSRPVRVAERHAL
jgi:hypothetical protein